MERSRKAKIIMSSVFVLLLSIGTLIASIGENEEQVIEEKVMGTEDYQGIPKITSVAPLSARKGDKYVYDVRVVDSDSDEFFLDLVDRPSWLYIEDNHIVKGIPDNSGSFKFVLRVSDGVNYSLQENYILVEDYE